MLSGAGEWLRSTAAVGFLQLMPPSAIATLLMRQRSFAPIARFLELVKGTAIGKAIVNLSMADIGRLIDAVESTPEASGYQDLLRWARSNPAKAREVVRCIADQSGLTAAAHPRPRSTWSPPFR